MKPRITNVAALVFASMLSGTLLIPAVRPFMNAAHPGSEWAMHAFFSVNMLGAAIGAPVFGVLSDRMQARGRFVAALAALDGALLVVCMLHVPVGVVLVARGVQGAFSVGALSILMGVAGRSRAGASHGGAMGIVGAAIVCAIAAGAPAGTLLLRVSVYAPFAAAVACAALVSIGAWSLAAADASVTRGAPRSFLNLARRVWAPAAWIGVERFTVGCFVVTFALYAHHVLGVSDQTTGLLFSCFLLPFAITTWPLGRLGDRLDRGALIGGGGLAYGAAFLVLPHASLATLPVVLGVAGTASAAIYAPALCVGVSVAPPSMRGGSMGTLNAAGTIGMLLGTAMAGILSHALLSNGMARVDAYSWVFRIAGVAPVVLTLISRRALASLRVPSAVSTNSNEVTT